MHLSDKLVRARQSVEFISRHDDQPLSVRNAVLSALKEHIDAELEQAKIREDRKAAEAVAGNQLISS